MSGKLRARVGTLRDAPGTLPPGLKGHELVRDLAGLRRLRAGADGSAGRGGPEKVVILPAAKLAARS
jgi:hypothetical protein